MLAQTTVSFRRTYPGQPTSKWGNIRLLTVAFPVAEVVTPSEFTVDLHSFHHVLLEKQCPSQFPSTPPTQNGEHAQSSPTGFPNTKASFRQLPFTIIKESTNLTGRFQRPCLEGLRSISIFSVPTPSIRREHHYLSSARWSRLQVRDFWGASTNESLSKVIKHYLNLNWSVPIFDQFQTGPFEMVTSIPSHCCLLSMPPPPRTPCFHPCQLCWSPSQTPLWFAGLHCISLLPVSQITIL